MKRADLHTRLSYALAWVRGRTDSRPKIGVVLGSGLGRFAERLTDAAAIPYAEIPEFPISKVPGHAGQLVIGKLPGENPTEVAIMQGRVHAYEGWTGEEVAFGVRVFCQLGVRALVLTNASGAVNPELEPGDLVRITDHLNLSGSNPLTGPNDDRLGPRFPDMTHAYAPDLGNLLEATAKRVGIPLKRGVYACMSGPSYETPAEVRMLRTLGADCVGMSTVPEVISARHMGVPVCAISVITNRAAGLSDKPLSHGEVALVAGQAGERLGELLSAFLSDAAR